MDIYKYYSALIIQRQEWTMNALQKQPHSIGIYIYINRPEWSIIHSLYISFIYKWSTDIILTPYYCYNVCKIDTQLFNYMAIHNMDIVWLCKLDGSMLVESYTQLAEYIHIIRYSSWPTSINSAYMLIIIIYNLAHIYYGCRNNIWAIYIIDPIILANIS